MSMHKLIYGNFNLEVYNSHHMYIAIVLISKCKSQAYYCCWLPLLLLLQLSHQVYSYVYICTELDQILQCRVLQWATL